MNVRPWSVVCDFDGTATVEDTADALSIEYRCMARVADVLFARGRLFEWCRGAGIACTPFETLHVVAARLA